MIKNKKIDINSLLFACYLCAVWAIYIFVNRYPYGSSKKVFVLSILGCFAIVVPMAFLIIRFVRKIQIKTAVSQYSKKARIRLMTGCFCLNLLILLIWFAAYYPGSFSVDSINQYGQALSGTYDDWHPFLHTLIFFTIPLKLTGHVASIVLFQIIYFAGVLAYFDISISRYFGIKAALIANAYIILNPYTGGIATYPWKDVGFSIMALLIGVCVFNIYYSKGLWLRKPWNVRVLAAALVLCTIFRHNAILYTFFVVLSLWAYCEKKICFRLTVLTVILLVVIKGPVYRMFDVEKPGERHVETMGMPLTIMANVAKEGAEELNQTTKDFLFKIAPQEVYKERYQTGDFNSIKWSGADTSIVEDTSVMGILSMTGECLLKYPVSSAKAFFMLTDVVYALEGDIEGDILPGVTGNDYGIELTGVEKLRALLDNYKWAFHSSSLRFFCHIGSTLFLMLAFMLGRCSFADKSDRKKWLLCVPILIYDLGTMLFLTGPDSRFFFVNFLVCPLVLLITLEEKEEGRGACT